MKKYQLPLLFSLLFLLQTGHAEVTCPNPQSASPEGIGISYLMVCHEVPDFDAAATGDLVTLLSSEDHASVDRYTPDSFNAFRDAAAFDWKNPIILWNKQQIKTKPSKGYITLTTGETLSGDLQLKVVKGELNELYLNQGKKNKKYKLKKVTAFGLNGDDPYRKTLASVVNPGAVRFYDGSEVKGGIRFVGTDRVVFRSDNGRIVQLTAFDLSHYEVESEEGVLNFVSQNGYFAKVVTDGFHQNENFTLAINPNPQPLKKKSTVGGFFKKAVQQAVVESVAREVGQGILSTGGSLEAALIGFEVATAAGEAYLTDPKQYRIEYYLIDHSAEETTLIHAGNVGELLEARLATCEPYTSMKISEQIEAVTIENIEQLTGWLNEC